MHFILECILFYLALIASLHTCHQIISLLEAEVAHLRAQLTAGPDEKVWEDHGDKGRIGGNYEKLRVGGLLPRLLDKGKLLILSEDIYIYIYIGGEKNFGDLLHLENCYSSPAPGYF